MLSRSNFQNIGESGIHIWGKEPMVFPYVLNDNYNWFVFSKNGQMCWTVKYTPKDKIKLKITETNISDWSDIKQGFFNKDFSKCNFQGLDIGGTRFTNCVFNIKIKTVLGFKNAIFENCFFIKNKILL